MTSPENCIFCMTPPEVVDRIIYEDDLVRSFLSSPRLTKGHALVIPKRHVEPPETLTLDEAQAIREEAERLRQAMLDSFAEGVDFFEKTRPHVPEGHNGTKMNHLHIHVLPSNPNSEMYERGIIWTRDHFSQLTIEETDEMIPILQGAY